MVGRCPDDQSQCGGDYAAHFTCVEDPVSAVSVALAECETLPDHLEDIVTGSHSSLGEAGRSLHRFSMKS